MTRTRTRTHNRRWCYLVIAPALLFIYSGNLVRLHHRLPHPAELHAQHAVTHSRSTTARTQPPPWRRRAVERDAQPAEAALWQRLQDQLLQRQEQCDAAVSSNSTATSQIGHLRGREETQSTNLLESLRQYGQATDDKNLARCFVPSSCPVPAQEKTKIALVLVIGEQIQTIDWRQVLVDSFKILPVVDELWIWVAQRVWTGHSNNQTILYKERFQRWKQQPNGTDSRIRVVMVEEEEGSSWIKAVEQLDAESEASTVIWAEVREEDINRSTVVSWQSFVNERVQVWRENPFPLHVSFWLDSVLHNGCNEVEVFHNASATDVKAATEQNDARMGLPSIHGLVHDRSWLCFWKHPIVQTLLQGSVPWEVTSLAATLWMAHLAGYQPFVTSDEEIGMTMNHVTARKIAEMINFLGGVGFPVENTTALSQECDS